MGHYKLQFIRDGAFWEILGTTSIDAHFQIIDKIIVIYVSSYYLYLTTHNNNKMWYHYQ